MIVRNGFIQIQTAEQVVIDPATGFPRLTDSASSSVVIPCQWRPLHLDFLSRLSTGEPHAGQAYSILIDLREPEPSPLARLCLMDGRGEEVAQCSVQSVQRLGVVGKVRIVATAQDH